MINSQINIPRKRQGRNEHLIPEVVERAKRILKQASSEENNALEAYDFNIEFFKPKINGRICTCQNVVESQASEESILSSDFLLEHLLVDRTNFCPVCFDQKYVGGYDKLNHNLIVLDSTNNPKQEKISLVKDKPSWYKPTNINGSLTWRLFIPKYYSDITIAVKWKNEPTFWNLTLNDIDIRDGLDQYRGQKVDIKLTMKDSSTVEAGLYCIFIYFKVNNEIINADLPRRTKAYTGEKNIIDEIETPITINFDNKVKIPNSQSVVIDNEGVIWRTISIEHNNPAGVVISYTAQARLVRRFENIFQLPSELIKINYNTNLYTFL